MLLCSNLENCKLCKFGAYIFNFVCVTLTATTIDYAAMPINDNDHHNYSLLPNPTLTLHRFSHSYFVSLLSSHFLCKLIIIINRRFLCLCLGLGIIKIPLPLSLSTPHRLPISPLSLPLHRSLSMSFFPFQLHLSLAISLYSLSSPLSFSFLSLPLSPTSLRLSLHHTKCLSPPSNSVTISLPLSFSLSL